MNQVFETFRNLFSQRLEGCGLFPDRPLRIDLVLNPHAGAFRSRRRCAALISELQNRAPAARTGRVEVAVWTTDHIGHEKSILGPVQGRDKMRLVVTAGGDGTSRGALISALDIDPEARKDVVFFRLPLGTGNDAADCIDFAAALDVLDGGGSKIARLPVLEVRAQGYPVHFSFNIASIGLDAFVAHITNVLKTIFPGNSYGLMVDVTSFFYEFFVTAKPSVVELTDKGKLVLRWTDGFALATMGTTGHKTYGAGKKIFPDDDNVCVAIADSVFTKLSYRKPFYTGTHRDLKGVTLASGDVLRVTGEVRIPLQMDGEVLWLKPENFPLTMSVVDHGLKVLKPFG